MILLAEDFKIFGNLKKEFENYESKYKDFSILKKDSEKLKNIKFHSEFKLKFES